MKLEHFLGEGNGTPFQTLAWKIPWTEEPGGLPSVGHTESDTTEVTQQQQQQNTF